MTKFNFIPSVLKLVICSFLLLLLQADKVSAQNDSAIVAPSKSSKKAKKVFYGQASFYGNKFHGKKTANGEIFSQDKFTAACNVLPLGTWIRVTNLKNGRSVVVKTNDRLHPKMRRLVDLSRAAAKKLGYISNGLTRVKVEVLDQKGRN
ncbi:MAG: septal ring lytic transglycosylase RlpA family protein [Ferruginibacter sp.]